MKLTLAFIVLLVISSQSVAAQALPGSQFIALCYHDVRDNVVQEHAQHTLSTSSENLIAQFNWLKGHGYTPVSMEQIIAASKGLKTLPEKAVLLTFDDGYTGVYERVFPLLKLYNYPAIIGLVGSWLEDKDAIPYAGDNLSRDAFLNWQQIREMASSGLIEFASHSYDLHKGVIANPQNNLLPAAVSRTYTREDTYEADEQYLSRIRNDLERNSQLLEKEIGQRPRIMVWPYGEYNQQLLNVANELGMPFNLLLGDEAATTDNINTVKRILVGQDMPLSDFAWLVRNKHRQLPVRTAHIDIDYLFDEDKAQQKRNLDQLLDRIKAMQINTVYLQAYADPDGDGVADAMYFPNRHLPMREDLFNRVAWQLRTRANVDVYAWMPVMAFALPAEHAVSTFTVSSLSEKDRYNYLRLSIFNPQVRQTINDIYEDLAKHASFNGLLFHDDAMLSDFEDSSEDALRVYQQWGFADNIAKIRSSQETFDQWTKMKTQYLIDWTIELGNTVKRHRPQIKTARNLYARVIMQPESQHWFAQSLPEFIRAYDYTAVMAMPYMEGSNTPIKWLNELVRKSKALAGSLDKVVFELQGKDWRRAGDHNSSHLPEQIGVLQELGAVHYGYYPDDFITQQPAMENIYPFMSLNRLPEFD